MASAFSKDARIVKASSPKIVDQVWDPDLESVVPVEVADESWGDVICWPPG